MFTVDQLIGGSIVLYQAAIEIRTFMLRPVHLWLFLFIYLLEVRNTKHGYMRTLTPQI